MLANYECDLHGHTNRSDGNDSPEEYIKHAEERGVKIVAITDHDATPPETVQIEGQKRDIGEYAKEKGIFLIKGIEISCETDVEDVHLVCFGCNWKDEFFENLESFTIKSKIDGYKKLVTALQNAGINIKWQDILQRNGKSIAEEKIQKKMIFERMAEVGAAPSWKDAKMLVKKTPEFSVHRNKPDAIEIIHEIHRQGGIVILAHPFLIAPNLNHNGKTISREAFIDEMIKAGLDGIEACYTYNKTSYDGDQSPEQIKEQIIRKYKNRGLIISGGSDYHGDGKRGVQNPRELGECGISLEEFMQYDKLKRLLKE